MTDALRKQLYSLLIVVAGGMALGRILCAELLLEPSLHRDENNPAEKSRRKWPATRPKPMATFSSNDRSRWCTVRALVDEGTFVIGRRDAAQKSETNRYGDAGIVFEDGWQTVDKVMNPATGEFYSTKPPLLPVMMAGEYWLLKHGLGLTLKDDADTIVRIELITFNLLPFLIYLVLLSRLVERFGTSDWGRLFVMATASFGTLMTPFLISMNNHTLGTCSALFAIYFAAKVWTDERPSWTAFAGAGFFAAFTVANELPALAFALGLFAVMGLKDMRRTLLEFVPAALIPAAAFLLTNYLAMGEFTPTYEKFGGPWYRYEGSHWAKDPDPDKPGIDFARMKESAGTYAFHVLLGHHGIFSLTPYVLLSVAGMILASRGLSSAAPERGLSSAARLQTWFGLLTLGLTIVIVGFYLFKSDNYGGWTNGPRWLMWLTPFWLLTMLPVVDQLSENRWGRGLAYMLLGLSVMSMSYSLWNPWRHPWSYRWMDANGWIPY
jgi:hypothetical protein